MAKDTKQRILDEALIMFANRGYEGTNMRELSAALGLGKSALYKHYESKEDIWNSLIDMLEAYYAEHFGSADKLPATPTSFEELKSMSLGMIDFTIHDEKIVLVRRLLVTEQFRDDRARKLAEAHFLTTLEGIFTHVFAGMMDAGLLKQDDPTMLAFAYTTPIAALIQQCDREPAEEPTIMARIAAFIDHFIASYGAA